MFDCHVHTNFSGDSNIEPESAVLAAVNAGLCGISFTDHLDYDYPATSTEIYELDPSKYSEYMNRLKSKYNDNINTESGKFKILKGIEIGFQKKVKDKVDKLFENYEFDFVIGSIHVLDDLELHNGDFCKNKSKERAYREYFEKTLDILRCFTNFDIFGHVDIIRRYGNFADTNLRHSDYEEIIDEILKIIIFNGRGIEINTSGYRYNLGTPMPNFDIIKRYKALGGEILTLGSDSHKIEHLAYKFDEAKQMALNAGFKYLAYYEGRKPNFYKI